MSWKFFGQRHLLFSTDGPVLLRGKGVWRFGATGPKPRVLGGKERSLCWSVPVDHRQPRTKVSKRKFCLAQMRALFHETRASNGIERCEVRFLRWELFQFFRTVCKKWLCVRWRAKTLSISFQRIVLIVLTPVIEKKVVLGIQIYAGELGGCFYHCLRPGFPIESELGLADRDSRWRHLSVNLPWHQSVVLCNQGWMLSWLGEEENKFGELDLGSRIFDSGQKWPARQKGCYLSSLGGQTRISCSWTLVSVA